MPSKDVSLHYEWANSGAAIALIAASAKATGELAVDTEFRRRDTFYPQVALVQLATQDGCWLIDPLALNSTDELSALLTDPAVVKVLHSASEDLEVFERWLGLLPTPMVDTQRAAALLGWGFGLSYRALVEREFGIELGKEETQSDWLQRPLSEAQCSYAVQDVVYLIRCWAPMRAELETKARLDWALEEGATMTTGGRGPLAKFKSAWKLPPESLGVLLSLIDWREDEARTRDRPRNWILHDKVLSEIAHRMPAAMPQLAAVEGIPPGVLRKQGKALLAAVSAGRSAAKSGEVVPLPRPADATIKALARKLGEHMQVLAESLSVNPEILLPARELELLARHQQGETIHPPLHWQGWRQAAVIQPLMNAIQ